MKSTLALISFITLLLTGCMDADPFGFTKKKIVGPYKLECFELENYYLHGPHPEDVGGGILAGIVEEIGWTDTHIVARRRANFRGDPDGWMIIHVPKRQLEGPVGEKSFPAKVSHDSNLPAGGSVEEALKHQTLREGYHHPLKTGRFGQASLLQSAVHFRGLIVDPPGSRSLRSHHPGLISPLGPKSGTSSLNRRMWVTKSSQVE